MKMTENIKLQTRLNSDIVNKRNTPYSDFELKLAKLTRNKYIIGHERVKMSCIYNCHGLTFASRRTCIFDAAEVRKILKEDDYESISPAQVLPGDIAVYFDSKGIDIEHTGIVIEAEKQANKLKTPLICSKWGKGGEFIHSAYQCPYNIGNIRFYRVTK